MVLTADDVADTQVGIVGTRRQVIRRHAVGTQQREIFDVSGGFHLLAVNGVGKANFSAVTWDRNRRANGSPAAARRSLSSWDSSGIGIEQPRALRAGFLHVTGVRGREVPISMVFIEDGFCDAAMKVETFGLLVFFVPVETQPAKPFKNRVPTLSVLRSTSVSSRRKTMVPRLRRAKSQLKMKVRALPTWRKPVGDGAKRTRSITSEYNNCSFRLSAVSFRHEQLALSN